MLIIFIQLKKNSQAEVIFSASITIIEEMPMCQVKKIDNLSFQAGGTKSNKALRWNLNAQLVYQLIRHRCKVIKIIKPFPS